MLIIFFLNFLFSLTNLQADLMDDLLTIEKLNQRLEDHYPKLSSHTLETGYLNMPSARKREEGTIGTGYSSVEPYENINLNIQFLNRLAVIGNYRIFKGIEDPVLTPLGFGDFSDKGVSLKFTIASCEDSRYELPAIAIGAQDFHGTKSFEAYYLVLTQVFLRQNLECSLGYGKKRMQGFFAGVHWMPWRLNNNSILQNVALTAEYDVIDYTNPEHEKHPDGRNQKSRLNYGAKIFFLDHLEASIGAVRGEEFAFSLSSQYNFGKTQGFIPKIHDPLLYRKSGEKETQGKNPFIHKINQALKEQGFFLINSYLCTNKQKQKELYLTLSSVKEWRYHTMKKRLYTLLSQLIPNEIENVIVVIESQGFPVQQYRLKNSYLKQFEKKQISFLLLDTLTKRQEASFFNKEENLLLFSQKRSSLKPFLSPRFRTVFGSSSGKFKYSLGLNFGVQGALFNYLDYRASLGYNAISSLGDCGDCDRLNPSQIINVRSDTVRYLKKRNLVIDQLYLQKSWNLQKGFYTRSAVGYFESAYAGGAIEGLYYPVNSDLALGLECAIVKKRSINGLDLESKIVKLEGFTKEYYSYTGKQAFLDIYYQKTGSPLGFKISCGRFLAKDYGAKFQLKRTFKSGLELYFWYTITNGNDRINGERYFDKGIGFSMPLDIFYTKTKRARWGYGISAWLRDVGARSSTGKSLYSMINQERRLY